MIEVGRSNTLQILRETPQGLRLWNARRRSLAARGAPPRPGQASMNLLLALACTDPDGRRMPWSGVDPQDTQVAVDSPTDSGEEEEEPLPYPERGLLGIKGLQPDFWPDKDEIAGNATGGVAMNLVWAFWEPVRQPAPCDDGAVEYDGYCFSVDSAVDADIREWTERGLVVTAVVYGVPEWARQSVACSPAAPGFEIFCAPDDPADYARFAGMLASRYDGRSGNGRVADFVVHNEVNANTWFDIGCGQGSPCDKELWLNTYAENYVAAYDAVLAEQPTAKVFVSLDHHFGSATEDLDAESPLLAGEDVLHAVAAAAGDRDWRVAYHPYPPDLLAPDFGPGDWPKVTYGNLGTLLGWLHLHYPGSVASREVHLTESGVNSISPYSSQAAQAEGVCRSFENVLGTPGIESYIYHRMQDHPHETAAGLGVGLRDYDGGAKQAWSTWALANREQPEMQCGFQDLPYVRLVRGYRSGHGHRASTRGLPEGYAHEQSYLLHREEQPDTVMLYECLVGQHTLLTPEGNCEGLHPMGPVGWAWTTEQSGSVALYRCSIGDGVDHFVSPDPACEGQTTERLLGWVLPG